MSDPDKEVLTRVVDPDLVMGYALLARAYRHLGDSVRARKELQQCRVRAVPEALVPAETDLFLSFLAEEDTLLSQTQKTEPDKP